MTHSPHRLSTTLNRKWVMKMVLFFLLLTGLAVWSAVDAFWLYPARGRHHADFALRAHLECLAKEGRLLAAASVEDPEADLAGLEAAGAAESRDCDALRYAWLTSLSRIHDLREIARANKAAVAAGGSSDGISSPTMFADPQATLDELTRRLGTSNSPKPLAAFDIPLQYLFLLLGAGGALWMLAFLLKCRRTVYHYDPHQHRLYLPGGASFTPAEIADVDKRDWHKYYVHLKLAAGGPEIKLDLLRFTPLEEWVLEMEKLHPNYEPPPAEPAPATPAPTPADA